MSADEAVWKRSLALLQEAAGNEVFTSDCIVQFLYLFCLFTVFVVVVVCVYVCVYFFLILFFYILILVCLKHRRS